ncbi:MAG: hypothetical protein AB8B91_07500, partial [Rubripirellula sp.]
MTNDQVGAQCRAYLLLLVAFVLQCFNGNEGLGQSPDVTPQSLEFRRQATRRMVFDRSQQIPLASLQPSKIVGLDLMHPEVGDSLGKAECSIVAGRLNVASGAQKASSLRWVGGFNPFATYELNLHHFEGSGRTGLRFQQRDQNNQLSACIVAEDDKYLSIEWVVVKDGKEVSRDSFAWPDGVKSKGQVRLRVQMLAVGVNLYIESEGVSHLVGYP